MSYAAICLARNRNWILPRWIEAMRSQITKPDKIVIGIHEDDLLELEDYQGIEWMVTNRDEMGWDRQTTNAEAFESSKSMARMRNQLVDKAFGLGVEYVLSCDSDVIIEPEASKMTRIAVVVCAPVKNTKGAYDVFLTRGEDHHHKTRFDEFDLHKGVIGCVSGGACCMIPRSIWESGARYEAHPQCENVGFGNSVIDHGFRYLCDTSIKTKHYTPEGILTSH